MNTNKFKARYFIIRIFKEILDPEPLNTYYPVLQWATVILMLILKCILVFQSQIIYLIYSFAQVDIPVEGGVFIKLAMAFNSDGLKCDIFIILKKNLYG